MTTRIRMGVALGELGRAARRANPQLVPTRAKLDEFCAALSESTDLEVTPYAAPRYDRLLKRLHLAEVELAWLPPLLALTALGRDARPVALPIRAQSPWFWAALFTHPDSDIEKLTDLPRAAAAWVDAQSASGYLVIRAALRADGIDPDRAFASEQFYQSHDAVVRAVLANRNTVGATYFHLGDDGEPSSAGWGDAPVRVLKRAGPIPGDVLAASRTLGDDVIANIARAMTEAPSAALLASARGLFAADRFVAPEASHRAHLDALARYLLRERLR